MVRPDWVKHELTPPRPSSQAFHNHPDDNLMSVYLEDEILRAGKNPSELQKIWPGYWIFSLTVQQIIDLSQEVTRADDENFPGHANVRDLAGPRRSQSKRTKMANMSILVSTGDIPLPSEKPEVATALPRPERPGEPGRETGLFRKLIRWTRSVRGFHSPRRARRH
jgi:hypothetical protein